MDVKKLEMTESSANIWLGTQSSIITIDVAWEAEEEQRTLAVQGTTSGAVLDFGTGDVAWYAGPGWMSRLWSSISLLSRLKNNG